MAIVDAIVVALLSIAVFNGLFLSEGIALTLNYRARPNSNCFLYHFDALAMEVMPNFLRYLGCFGNWMCKCLPDLFKTLAENSHRSIFIRELTR